MTLVNDIATLQFFFNLGIEYFKSSGIRMNAYSAPNPQFVPNVPENAEVVGGNPVSAVQNDVKNEEFGSSSVQQNGTSEYGRINRNVNNNNSSNKRRTYNDREFVPSAKAPDVKFNSNVKNLHKNKQIINQMKQNNLTETVTPVVNTPVTLDTNTGFNPAPSSPLTHYLQQIMPPMEANELSQYGTIQQFDLQQVRDKL